MTSSSTRPLTLIVRKISVRQNCPNALELIGGGTRSRTSSSATRSSKTVSARSMHKPFES